MKTKTTSRLAAILAAATLFSAPAALLAQRPWDAPPGSYRQDLQRNAFRDGLNGARKDLENRRRPDVNNRDEFRNYRGPDPRGYRSAFRDGYQAFWRHQGPRR